ncbi:MAG: polysaccharide deacetylase family protein, partial [Solirubrobacteraceae bacterium]
MYADDHRIPGSQLKSLLTAGVMGSYLLPALASPRPGWLPGSPAPIWAALRGALGVEDRARGCGYALTFDDGPHPQGTPAVLEILARAGVQATFFLVGEQVRRDRALVREIADGGHGIGLH